MFSKNSIPVASAFSAEKEGMQHPTPAATSKNFVLKEITVLQVFQNSSIPGGKTTANPTLLFERKDRLRRASTCAWFSKSGDDLV